MRQAILPDWWGETCQDDPALLPDVEVRVARFLRLPVSAVRDSASTLTPPSYAGVQLRRARNLDRERLVPAIHTAMQIASAVVRNLRAPAPTVQLPPADGIGWRNQIQQNRVANTAIGLDDVLEDLWKRGIPVVPLDTLPAPNFQGLACMTGDRPVILLGQKHDAPGRVAFFTAHEVGHIAAGDCTPDHPIVDEDEEVADDTDVEDKAEKYAIRALAGGEDVPDIDTDNYRDLATKAAQIERSQGIEAGAVIFRWARRTGDYALASMAVQALYRAAGARRLLRKHFDRHVDIDSATETDRSLLLCVFGEPNRDASSH